MEAQLFQQVCDALRSRNGHIKIPLRNSCPVTKIAWSSFDFLAGPLLKFVWESDSIHEENHDCNISVDETIDGNNSTDSSFSKNTHESDSTIAKDQYEDIDEILKLPKALEVAESSIFNSNFDINSSLTFCEASKDQINLKTSSRMTMSTFTNSSFTIAANSQHQVDSDDFQIDKSNIDETKNKPSTSFSVIDSLLYCENDEFLKVDTELGISECTVMSDSCVDSGIAATTSIDSLLCMNCDSSNLQRNMEEPMSNLTDKSVFKGNQIRYRVGSENCDINFDLALYKNLGKKHNYNKYATQDIVYCEEAMEEDQEEIRKMREVFSRMTQSQASYTSMVTSAFYNEGDSNIKDQSSASKMEFYREADMLTELNSIGGSDCGVGFLTDEEFITKFVLAEQICSAPLLMSSIVHKITTVPSRRIAIGSFLFSLKRIDDKNLASTSAISIIVSLEMLQWYMERQKIFEEFFIDMITSFKAAYLVENMEDIICRVTKDLVDLFELISALDRWPLLNSNCNMARIQSSYLWEKEQLDNLDIHFLAATITACLMTKGMCTVIGSNTAQVLKMMLTLSLFINESDRVFCLKPFRLPFSPYLRLQAIKRSELEDAYTGGVNCHWSLAVIDLDRNSVTYSGNYMRHRTLKRRAQFFQAGLILKESGIQLTASEERRCSKETRMELHVIKADASVMEFLEKLFLLPLNRVARIAFIDHFHLRLENRANAFLQFVKDVSMPLPNDKRSALSAPWSIVSARRALNLQSDSAYFISLAKADNMKPSFAEFIYQTAYSIEKMH